MSGQWLGGVVEGWLLSMRGRLGESVLSAVGVGGYYGE